MRRVLPVAAFCGLAGAAAAECDLLHTVASGDTVITIAQQYYANHTQRSAIYYGNPERLGGTLLMQDEVDAVTANEFLGLTKISELGLQRLHVVISKRHHRGTALLYRFKAGLAELRASARCDEIVSHHPGLFREQVR